MLAFHVHMMAKQYDLTESEFVRKVLLDLVEREKCGVGKLSF
jgi:hypothetical protein